MAVAEQILSEAREEVGRADGKASTLLAAVSVVASLLVGAMLAGDWSPEDLSCVWRRVWWAGALAAGGAIFCFGLAVFPRIKNKVVDRPSLTYFNDVALLGSTEDVKRQLEEIVASERELDQMIALSKIARRKYLWIRRGMVLTGLAIALLTIAAILGR